MYPNLYYVFKDWWGVEWNTLSFINTFGLLVALAFIVAAWVLTAELHRKEKLALLLPREEMITVGSPASIIDLLINGLVGFGFGYKILGLIFSKPVFINPQEYIFSKEGSIVGGILMAALLAGIKWREKNKVKLKEPERRVVRIWPHDRVGDIIVLGLIFGILGAKLFDNFEHWDEFIANPIQKLLSQSGLTFYGGLILAAITICWYAYKKDIKIKHLVDAAAPALMIAYAIGRLGCQISGDGDWGVFNSAYVSDNQGKVSIAKLGDFEKALQDNVGYFTEGKAKEGANDIYVTDRAYNSLEAVPHKSFKGPSFLPSWFFAYSYPQNVNKDGIAIPGITDEHNRVLPQPVFPTPLYEAIICSLLFLLMWFIRKSIKAPMFMFGLYLSLNGAERLMVELIRVNKAYLLFGIETTQAEMIAFILLVSGGLLMWVSKKLYTRIAI